MLAGVYNKLPDVANPGHESRKHDGIARSARKGRESASWQYHKHYFAANICPCTGSLTGFRIHRCCILESALVHACNLSISIYKQTNKETYTYIYICTYTHVHTYRHTYMNVVQVLKTN